MEDRACILVVDDEPAIRGMLESAFVFEGYRVITAGSGAEAVAAVQEGEPDIVLMDVVMPEMSGIEACKRIRKVSAVPIIILTALRNETEIVRGLDAGADEYVTKPLALAELGARVRAALRRFEIDRAVLNKQRKLVLDNGELIVDLDRRTVTGHKKRVAVSATEFRILSFLIAQAGRVVSHERILDHVWGQQRTAQNSSVRAAIRQLRKKIERDPENPQLITSAHGVGYRFEEPAVVEQ